MLRVLLPPNLASAAPRNAIPVRLELDLKAEPPAAFVPALAILQRIGVTPQPVSFVQLTRAQLRELLSALVGEKVFFRLDRPADPLPWNGLVLPGVSEHLAEKPAAPPPPPPAAKLRNTEFAPGATREPAKTKVRNTDFAKTQPLAPMTVDGSEHYLAITLPARESVLYAPALEFLQVNRFVLDPLTRKWWLRDRHKVLNILATHGAELRERYDAEFTPNFDRNTAHLKTAAIAAEVAEAGDDYDVSLGLKAGSAPEAQIRAAIATGRGYIEDNGTIFLVDRARLAQLEQAHRALAQEPSASALGKRRISRARVAEVSDLLEQIAPGFQAPETWRARSTALHNLSTLAPAPIPAWFAATLRPYQQLGVAWLWHLYRQQLGGILADEMGLGKTPQALALLAAATADALVGGALCPDEKSTSGHKAPPTPNRAARAARPHLVVVPASLMENWRREAARFAPALRTFVHHGAQRLAAVDFAAHNLVLTSYGTLARDVALFESVEFDLVLADEAQHLKNRRTQAAQSLRALRGRGRFLLTGTPLENSLDDLRSLFEFLMPGFVPKLPPGLKRDERTFHDERLRAQTAPYILRRTKSAVAPELPPKIEQVVWCEPSAAQTQLYRRLQEDSERELIDLAAKGASENRLRLATLTQLLRLRQICCDPRLLEKVGRVVPDEPSSASTPKPRLTGDGSPYPDSAKLDAFRELLAESIDEGHRMLVFSQFTSLLALLREELEAQGVAFCYLDGSMSAKARQAEVDRFQSSDDVPVFLISLKAGGTGLNLTGADVVVHYDPWWNPAAEAQATDRTHRIGQTRVVTSYRLICSGTVEEKVMALQDAKRALLADVFEASDAAAARLSLADLKSLLA
ncbi:MAG: DEAD/DEAH box helicase [Opitutae bacterium]|nr:DEAD/DEAH box helicase [Opitutae bacterium]